MSLITVPDPAPAAAADPVVGAVVPDPVAAPAADPAVPAAAPAAEPAAPVAPPVRPEGLPDAFWDETTGVKTTEAVARLTELETAEAARVAGIPADAASYKLEPAEPILDPVSGKAIAFNAEDPLAKAATAWAHENGVTQIGLSKLLGVFAQNEMAALAQHNATVAAETAKLGANSDARFTAVSTALKAHAGEAGAKAIMSTLGSADAVIALEAVVKALGGPSIGTPPAGATSDTAGLSGVELLAAIRAKQG